MIKHHIRPLAPFALAWMLSAMPGTAAAQTAKRVNPISAPAAPRPACVVAEFKGIGLHTHDPQERSIKAVQWLQRNGSACSLAQAITITSNRSAWLGTADTPMLMATLEGMIESRQNAVALSSPTAANAPGQSAAALPVTTQTPDARAPTVANAAPALKPVVTVAAPVAPRPPAAPGATAGAATTPAAAAAPAARPAAPVAAPAAARPAAPAPTPARPTT